jgi:hypothetical protein
MLLMTRTTALFVLLSAGVIAGCAAKPVNYDISVTNKISQPVTVWITKDSPPYEPGWNPPEQVAANTTGNKVLGGVVIEPGITMYAKISGKTTPQNPAILRVYEATTIDGICAISRGSTNRADVPLEPGKSHLDILVEGGQLTAENHH